MNKILYRLQMIKSDEIKKKELLFFDKNRKKLFIPFRFSTIDLQSDYWQISEWMRKIKKKLSYIYIYLTQKLW